MKIDKISGANVCGHFNVRFVANINGEIISVSLCQHEYFFAISLDFFVQKIKEEKKRTNKMKKFRIKFCR